jgi:hypothetical protein
MTTFLLTNTRISPLRLTGGALIALAVFFNLPYAWLAVTFNYPAILREPAETIFAAFTAGGTQLILAWYAFALAAMLFMPFALAHAFAGNRLKSFPALAISAALIGALAGLLQAMGLLRWVMVIPELARTADPATSFALIHAYAGVALGEHLGMLLTAFHVALMATIQFCEDRRTLAILGGVTTAAITLGAFEGLALALQADGTLLSLGSVAGYLLLTAWLIASGIGLIRR